MGLPASSTAFTVANPIWPGTAPTTRSAPSTAAQTSDATEQSVRLHVTPGVWASPSKARWETSATWTWNSPSLARSSTIAAPTRPAPNTAIFMASLPGASGTPVNSSISRPALQMDLLNGMPPAG